MNEFSKYVGSDVHKETIAMSVADGPGGEVRYRGEIANTPEAVTKMVRQLGKGGACLSFCYGRPVAITLAPYADCEKTGIDRHAVGSASIGI